MAKTQTQKKGIHPHFCATNPYHQAQEFNRQQKQTISNGRKHLHESKTGHWVIGCN